MSEVSQNFLDKHDEEGGSRRILKNWNLKFVGLLAISWSLFQLWYASPLPFILDFGKFIDVPARAIHLAFGMSLCFLAYPAFKSNRKNKINKTDFLFALISVAVTIYLVIDYEGLTLHEPEIINDLPAGGRRLVQKASGYDYTIVSGEIAFIKGEATGALNGRLIRNAH